MKLALILIAVLFFSTPSWSQTERKVSAVDHVKQAEANRAIIRNRATEIEKLIKSVQWEPHKSPGLDSPEQERNADQDWQKWFVDVRKDLQEYARACKTFQKMSDQDVVSKMAEMNMQFVALQEATQMESRRYNTLSNASKARHEVAMNAIRNMK